MHRIFLLSSLCLAGSALLVAGFIAPLVRAESAIEFWIKQHQRRPVFPSEPKRVFQPETDMRRFTPHNRKHATRKQAEPPRQSADKWTPTPDLERIVCRRQCDGAQLVLGILPQRAKRREAEAMCAAAGRGAKTALIVEAFKPGSAFRTGPQLASAAGLLSGRAALIPDAADGGSAPCPDTLQRRSMMVPILADATLRHGDIVATASGFKMFVGKGKPPFREKDFVDASKKMRKFGTVSMREPIPEASIEAPPDDMYWPAANPAISVNALEP